MQNQFLPQLINLRTAAAAGNDNCENARPNRKRVSVQTQTSGQEVGIISNSALVHQRASGGSKCSPASDQLAVASVQTGASLPLMIGNRSKCVLNQLINCQQQQQPQETSRPVAPVISQQQQQQQQQQLASGPQNAALRAEQRLRGGEKSMSVVRPVMNNNTTITNLPANGLIDDWMLSDKLLGVGGQRQESSVLDELIQESKLNYSSNNFLTNDLTCVLSNWANTTATTTTQLTGEMELKHQVLRLRREEHELNRGIMRQHQFVLKKLEQRKRHLQIIQSIWLQRDFKQAIEKLVDIYHQGLIFSNDINGDNNNNKLQLKLKSLNISLVVDILSVIILRPRLWSLEICQLLLPIINQDLLKIYTTSQHKPHHLHTNDQHITNCHNNEAANYYLEIGLKCVHLILTHFSTILKTTLLSLKEANKFVGVDLSREQRIKKCLATYKLLLESEQLISSTTTATNCKLSIDTNCKLAGLQREICTMFSNLIKSIGAVEQ